MAIRTRLLTLALACSLSLVACGGGGGSTTDTSSSGGTSNSDDTATTTGSTATTRGSDPITYNCPTDKYVVIDMEDRFAPTYGISDNISNTDNGGLGVTNWGDFSTASFTHLGTNSFFLQYDSRYPEKLLLNFTDASGTLLSPQYTADFSTLSEFWGTESGFWYSHPQDGIFVIGFN